ncbi:Putative OTU domain, papain-like cysteine peptidase superfamily, ubiquitin thioesterase OTU1/2/3 [Septoria linicola]|uniref:Ubiquitin thioesterase OTU n=1 Tax=Septoria linicola TaxID=215465 RepID=A0A9Q9B057_9PEZI|nr:putative OTU domain, papain-like cysteine peptidase superfamily, ubiquitin thioesterase OTU1/2/3 [Septoria linicola]USW59257.1 Putative OTU domain, papain-like cysteine peptidase superfamily, ubiquitin thioesterase OTU1/2/3 [Septoria linicola]
MTGSIRLRVRGPEGQATISIDSQSSWSHLTSEISEKTGVADFDLKHGFPPQALNTESIDGQTKLSDLPFKLNGEQLTISPRNVQANLTNPMAGTQPSAEAVGSLPARGQISPPTHKPGDFPSQPLGLTRKPKGNVEDDPPEIPVPQLEGVMVLRVMPDDNSCMFRALSSAVLGPALDGMTELRSAVAQEIQAKPDFYTEGMLEKRPDDYCRWIQREDSWGGGIELSILSEKFDIEICSIDVQTLRVDKFNERKPTRCILVYSGIHYDVCAVTAFAGADPGADRKVFDVMRLQNEEIDGGALDAARELCRVLQGRHYFTDTHGFSIKCNTCGETGKGQQWAQGHAKKTGHGDYGEAD